MGAARHPHRRCRRSRIRGGNCAIRTTGDAISFHRPGATTDGAQPDRRASRRLSRDSRSPHNNRTAGDDSPPVRASHGRFLAGIRDDSSAGLCDRAATGLTPGLLIDDDKRDSHAYHHDHDGCPDHHDNRTADDNDNHHFPSHHYNPATDHDHDKGSANDNHHRAADYHHNNPPANHYDYNSAADHNNPPANHYDYNSAADHNNDDYDYDGAADHNDNDDDDNNHNNDRAADHDDNNYRPPDHNNDDPGCSPGCLLRARQNPFRRPPRSRY